MSQKVPKDCSPWPLTDLCTELTRSLVISDLFIYLLNISFIITYRAERLALRLHRRLPPRARAGPRASETRRSAGRRGTTCPDSGTTTTGERARRRDFPPANGAVRRAAHTHARTPMDGRPQKNVRVVRVIRPSSRFMELEEFFFICGSLLGYLYWSSDKELRAAVPIPRSPALKQTI